MSNDVQNPTAALSRRTLLSACAAAGLGQTLFPGALLALATSPQAASASKPQTTSSQEDLRGWPAITPAMITAAAAIAAVHVTEEQTAMLLDGVLGQRNSALRVRELHLANRVAPVAVTNPIPAGTTPPQAEGPRAVRLGAVPSVAKIVAEAKSVRGDGALADEAWAFATVRELGVALRQKNVTSTGLTKMYLARLRRYDPLLKFVITYTEERALRQAAQADRDLAAGHDRGPLHGIPWGAKDLLAVKGYPTTWGAAGFEHQQFDEDAEVVKRLDAAGAVLVAKLSMGALAQGDLWGYPAGSGKPGGRTRKSVESAPGIEWKLCRIGECGCGRLCRLCTRHGDAGVDLLAVHALRRDGTAAELWAGAAYGCDGALVVDGQDRLHCTLCRGLRAGAARDCGA